VALTSPGVVDFSNQIITSLSSYFVILSCAVEISAFSESLLSWCSMSDLSGCLNVTVYLMAYRILVEYCLSDHGVVFQANGPQLITKGWSKNRSRWWRRGHLHTESKSYFRRRKVATRSCPSVRMTLVELSE
jgi:hypothetical protein